MKPMIFEDRREAGRQLAAALIKRGYKIRYTLALGIPRGGVVVADEVAQALSAPLDVIITRKLRAPYQPELGIGAVVDGEHISIINEELVHVVGAKPDYLDREIAYQIKEIDRRLQFYRGNRPAPEISGRTVIVIDDGIATGYTFRASLEGLRRRNPAKLQALWPSTILDRSSAYRGRFKDNGGLPIERSRYRIYMALMGSGNFNESGRRNLLSLFQMELIHLKRGVPFFKGGGRFYPICSFLERRDRSTMFWAGGQRHQSFLSVNSGRQYSFRPYC